jgi:hypothetical protein
LVWEGRYYQLWERAVRPTVQILEHVPFGDANRNPYCGQALSPKTGLHLPLVAFCPVEPVGLASCGQVRSIARYATSHQAVLLADERQPSTYVLADQTQFPTSWLVSPTAHVLAAFTPGSDLIGLPVKTAGRYTLWLGGNFGRGFDISLDGVSLGRVHNALADINGYVPVTTRRLDVGVHTIDVTYPGADPLVPGDGDELGTMLASVVLEPVAAESGQLVTVSPADATRLCGQSVDWIEVVAPQT